MCFKKVSIIIFIFFKLFLYIKCINLPLAPFQIKIQCKSGLQKGDGEVIKNKEICPSSSTSCGYFEIPMKNENISIFECVDSSILSGEDDQEESAKELLFSQICNHIPKCQVINIALLNPSFKKYLINTYKLSSNVFEKKYIIFCCSMNSAVLEKTIKLKDRTQKVKSSNLLIKCDGKTCGVGAIGCLSYQQIPKARIVNAQDYIDVENDNKDFYSDETYIDEDNIKNKEITDDNSYDNDNIYIEPVQIEFNNEFNQDYMKKRFVRSTDKEYNCVYPHLNDEIYRYCSMIYTNSNKDRCFKGKGFKICCCYVRPEALTCDPEQKELPPIITLPPKISLPITTTQSTIIYSTTITQPKQIIISKELSTTPTAPSIKVNKNVTRKGNQKNKYLKIFKNHKKNTTKMYEKLSNKKCKFVTKQKMRRLKNDRYVPYFYKQEVCNSKSKNFVIIKWYHFSTFLMTLLYGSFNYLFFP